MLSSPLERKKPTMPSGRHSNTSTSTSISLSFGSDASVGNSSPATSESGSPDERADKIGSGRDIDPPDTSMAIDIVLPSDLTGFVLFAVHGSRRLQSAYLRLAQIDVTVFKDDDSFFDEMIVQYNKLRGFLRRTFSFWVFHTCEFVMV